MLRSCRSFKAICIGLVILPLCSASPALAARITVTNLACGALLWVGSLPAQAQTVSAASFRDGLVAYYPFDRDSNDYSGFGNNLGLNGGASFRDCADVSNGRKELT